MSSLSTVISVTVAVPAIMLELVKSRQSCSESPSLRVSVVSERLNSASERQKFTA